MHTLEVQNRNSGSRATGLVSISDRAEEGAVMRPAKAISFILSIVGVFALAPRTPAQTAASRQPIVIAASVVIDGKGHILHDVRIVIEGSKIVAIVPKIEGPVDYDLRGLTVLPGWIDAHVHIIGGMTLSQEQLNAACDEAKKQGLRTLVHAYKEAVR